MAELWEWTGTDDKNGRTRVYQTNHPSLCTEAGMLEHLKASYPNLTITTLRRCHAREAKSSVGPVERHTYLSGAWDYAMRQLGYKEPPQSIRERFRKDQLSKVSGIPPERINLTPIRQRVSNLVTYK